MDNLRKIIIVLEITDQEVVGEYDGIHPDLILADIQNGGLSHYCSPVTVYTTEHNEQTEIFIPLEDTLETLQYIADSPSQEYGGFHKNVINTAKSAIYWIKQLRIAS